MGTSRKRAGSTSRKLPGRVFDVRLAATPLGLAKGDGGRDARFSSSRGFRAVPPPGSAAGPGNAAPPARHRCSMWPPTGMIGRSTGSASQLVLAGASIVRRHLGDGQSVRVPAHSELVPTTTSIASCRLHRIRRRSREPQTPRRVRAALSDGRRDGPRGRPGGRRAGRGVDPRRGPPLRQCRRRRRCGPPGGRSRRARLVQVQGACHSPSLMEASSASRAARIAWTGIRPLAIS